MKNVQLAIAMVIWGTLLSAQTVPNPIQTDEIIIDNGQPGKADPGDRIRYKVTIQNTGAAPATGAQLNIVPDPRTTFAPGSFRSSPLAVPDAYAVTGNVPISVPDGASDLLGNDFDDNTAGLTATAGTFATTQGGSITIAANGSFTYTPPAGFTGMDTYTYTLNDGNGVGGPVPATDMGTVTFTISNLIWFIDNSAAAGDGRRNTPFNSLAAFNGGSAAAGDVVYIEHTGTDYSGGIVLANNERLFGEGHTGAANLSGVLPFTLAANSVALPNISGTRPVITNAGGDGILLAQNNTIRGLNVGNSADFAIDDNGNVGTLTISEVNVINSTGGGFRTDNGGTLSVTLGALTSGGGTNGVHLGGTGGSFTVSGATSVSNTTGIGLLIDGTSSGASTNFAAITVGNTGSHGIQLINNTGTVTASGTTTINSPVAGGNISLNISGGGGAITFAGLTINGRRDKGIRIAGGNRNITTGTLSINNPNISNAIGLEILSLTGGTISFGTTTINNNAAAGSAVEIQSSAAAVTFASGSAISNSASNEFFVNGGNGNITYNGSITSTAGPCLAVNSRTGGTTSFTGNISSTGTGIGIEVGSNAGGTVEFSGSSKSITSGTAIGVSLTSNTGATINFTGGGLAITTTSGTGFNATGGGTVTVQGTGNTINCTSATALNVANTTIGASGLTFQSISSGNNTAAADPANGIVLNNTGANGGLTVTGTGSSGTGGTIQFSTATGFLANSTYNLNLSYMNVTNNGNAVGEHGIELIQLTGSGSMTGCTVSGSSENNVRIANTGSGTLSSFNVTNTSITNTNMTTGNDGILLENNGTGSMTVSITGCTFTDNKGDHFQTATTASASGTTTITFSNNILNTTPGNDPNVVGGGITISPSGSSDVNYTISNNNIQQAFDEAININLGTASTAAASLIGTISNNIIGTPGDPDSGCESGTCISVVSNGAGVSTVAITGNQAYQYANPYGIFLTTKEGSSNLNATVTGNIVKNPGSFALNGIRIDAGAAAGDSGTLCIALSGNDVTGSGFGTDDIRLRQRFNTTIRLPGYGGANNDTAAVNAFVAGNNDPPGPTPAPTVSSAHNVGGGGGGFVGGAPCQTP